MLELEGTTLLDLAESKLSCYCDEVYFSINKSQESFRKENCIVDSYEEQGPLSGIISALRTLNQSIILLGVDLPLITKQRIKQLIRERNRDFLCTSYRNKTKHIWEPMLSIWELGVLPDLEEYFNNGGRSMQQFLNSIPTQAIDVEADDEFKNVNTLDEFLSISNEKG